LYKGLFPDRDGFVNHHALTFQENGVSFGWEVMTMFSKCTVALMLSVAGIWIHFPQDSVPKRNAEEGRAGIVGVWRGHSECAVKNGPCHDELNVYRFSKIAGDPNRFFVTASKIVNGKEIVMGSSACKYDEKKVALECDKPVIQMTVDGDKMEGVLKLEDGAVYRRIYLKKES